MPKLNRLVPLTATATIAAALVACGSGSKSAGPAPMPTAPPEVLQNDLPSESPAPEMAPETTGNRDEDLASGTDKGACITENLEVVLANEKGAAGSRIFEVEFTNTGRKCDMIGFPGVSIVGDGVGRQIGAPANREPVGTDYVTLNKGDSATATVTVSQAGAYDETTCSPTEADGLRVFPPANTNSVYVPIPGLTGCDNPDVSILSVGPVR
ncbi:DUF4232 domain-containing protein [Corynebacterium cystitidis]|uniref:DUF4232 domain-containing protein n=1 Tax=Corynebacterium cystitidis TaxID=35757 RepID=UPI00211E116A|nr:DUF4232 domain-containing protein [Corynebacterium cystitidis]